MFDAFNKSIVITQFDYSSIIFDFATLINTEN